MKRKRRNYFVDRDFQGRQMAMTMVLMLIISLATGWIVWATTYTVIIEEIGDRVRVDELLLNLGGILLARVSLTIVAIACLATVAVMFVMHRIAGPLYRVRRQMREIAEGKIPVSVKFRSRDEFQDLSRALDAAVNKMAEMCRENTGLREECIVSLAKAKTLLGSGDAQIPEVKKEMEKMQLCLEKLKLLEIPGKGEKESG